MRNLAKCIQQIGIDVEGLVFSGLASSESTLTETEKELGVALVDIGGGTTDVTLFVDGSIAHSVVIPIGGKNITNDLAIGIRGSLEDAEKIKLELSQTHKKREDVLEDDEDLTAKKKDVIDLANLGLSEDLGTLSRKTLVDGIIKPRLTEIFTLIGMEIKRSGFAGLLPAGVVVTGGAAETIGIVQIGKEVLRMPVRVAHPTGLTGLIDEISSPAYASLVGAVLYGSKVSTSSSGMSLPLVSGGSIFNLFKKIFGWLRSFLP
jgi:cell division protein FtsA